MAGGSSRESEKLQRKFFRRNVHSIWKMITSGRRDELSARDNDLAEILTEHEEYRGHFENTEILDGREYEAGEAFNPFLHISIHQMVEDQLSANSPAETTLFLEAMECRGFARHEAVHFIIMIMLHVMHASVSADRTFDAPRYKRLLIKCKEAEPSEMDQIIDDDFSNHTYRHDLH